MRDEARGNRRRRLVRGLACAGLFAGFGMVGIEFLPALSERYGYVAEGVPLVVGKTPYIRIHEEKPRFGWLPIAERRFRVENLLGEIVYVSHDPADDDADPPFRTADFIMSPRLVWRKGDRVTLLYRGSELEFPIDEKGILAAPDGLDLHTLHREFPYSLKTREPDPVDPEFPELPPFRGLELIPSGD